MDASGGSHFRGEIDARVPLIPFIILDISKDPHEKWKIWAFVPGYGRETKLIKTSPLLAS